MELILNWVVVIVVLYIAFCLYQLKKHQACEQKGFHADFPVYSKEQIDASALNEESSSGQFRILVRKLGSLILEDAQNQNSNKKYFPSNKVRELMARTIEVGHEGIASRHWTKFQIESNYRAVNGGRIDDIKNDEIKMRVSRLNSGEEQELESAFKSAIENKKIEEVIKSGMAWTEFR